MSVVKESWWLHHLQVTSVKRPSTTIFFPKSFESSMKAYHTARLTTCQMLHGDLQACPIGASSPATIAIPNACLLVSCGHAPNTPASPLAHPRTKILQEHILDSEQPADHYLCSLPDCHSYYHSTRQTPSIAGLSSYSYCMQFDLCCTAMTAPPSLLHGDELAQHLPKVSALSLSVRLEQSSEASCLSNPSQRRLGFTARNLTSVRQSSNCLFLFLTTGIVF